MKRRYSSEEANPLGQTLPDDVVEYTSGFLRLETALEIVNFTRVSKFTYSLLPIVLVHWAQTLLSNLVNMDRFARTQDEHRMMFRALKERGVRMNSFFDNLYWRLAEEKISSRFLLALFDIQRQSLSDRYTFERSGVWWNPLGLRMRDPRHRSSFSLNTKRTLHSLYCYDPMIEKVVPMERMSGLRIIDAPAKLPNDMKQRVERLLSINYTGKDCLMVALAREGMKRYYSGDCGLRVIEYDLSVLAGEQRNTLQPTKYSLLCNAEICGTHLFSPVERMKKFRKRIFKYDQRRHPPQTDLTEETKTFIMTLFCRVDERWKELVHAMELGTVTRAPVRNKKFDYFSRFDSYSDRSSSSTSSSSSSLSANSIDLSSS
jgi:hypothetical protein